MFHDVPALDTLTIDADSPSEVLPSQGQVSLQVEVIKSNGASSVFSIHVPRGSSLFEALNLLQDKKTGFKWVKRFLKMLYLNYKITILSRKFVCFLLY